MRIPLGETEIGAIYECPTSTFFYTLDCAYYNNCMIHTKPSAIICTYSKFKKLYPFYISSNHRCIK